MKKERETKKIYCGIYSTFDGSKFPVTKRINLAINLHKNISAYCAANIYITNRHDKSAMMKRKKTLR